MEEFEFLCKWLRTVANAVSARIEDGSLFDPDALTVLREASVLKARPDCEHARQRYVGKRWICQDCYRECPWNATLT